MTTVLSGDYRGQNATTQSRDGNEWMVQITGGQSKLISRINLKLCTDILWSLLATIVAAAILCVTLD